MKYELYIGKHCHTINGPDGLLITFLGNDLEGTERVARLMFEAVDDEFHMNMMGLERISTELNGAKEVLKNMVEYAECNDPRNPHLNGARKLLDDMEGKR